MPIRTNKKAALEVVFNRLRKVQAVADDDRADEKTRADAQRTVDELKAELRQLGVNTDPPPPGHNAPPPDDPVPDDPQYKSLVQHGLAALQQGSNAMWQLGKLASQVHTQYGQNLLQRYADDIGCNYETLKRCRSTYAAWETQIGPDGPNLPFAACRALVTVPNRVACWLLTPR